jgi:hypothetical protein
LMVVEPSETFGTGPARNVLPQLGWKGASKAQPARLWVFLRVFH